MPNKYYWEKINKIFLYQQIYLLNKELNITTHQNVFIINYFINNFINKNKLIKYNSKNVERLTKHFSKKICVSFVTLNRAIYKLDLDGAHEFFYIINQYILLNQKMTKGNKKWINN